MPASEKTDLVNNIAGHLKNAKKHIQERQIAHFKRADAEYGQRIEEAILTLSSKA
jgi:catalase